MQSTLYIRDGRSPVPEKEITSRIMSSISDRNTKPEMKLRKSMYANGIRGYRLHWKKVPGRPDICFPGKKLAIFVNGCFWHRCPYCRPPMPKSHTKFWEKKFETNVNRDKKKIRLLKKDGWKVLVLWECHIKKDINKSILKVKQVVYG